MNVLGIHVGHDANAALIMNGKIVADVMEERFSRVKHSADPPRNAVAACLAMGNIRADELDIIAITGQNLHKDIEYIFKLQDIDRFPTYFQRYSLTPATLLKNYDHHMCHAACAYYLSPFSDPALIFVSDGFGDDCSISLWTGQGTNMSLLKKYPSEGSLGWFYSNVTEALGWIHGDGEGKTMALAAKGDPANAYNTLGDFCPRYHNGELKKPHHFGNICKVTERGAIQWHMPDATKIRGLLNGFTREELAASAQELIEENHLSLCTHWLQRTGIERLCLAGGVFLNIILNRKLADTVPLNKLFIYPNPGDSGLALGAALCALSEYAPEELPGSLDSPYLGPNFTDQEILYTLRQRKIRFTEHHGDSLIETVARALSENLCVGWFQGRMESGPRALGNRSILMNPCHAENQEYINTRVKFREPFRPFCPSILDTDRDRYLVEKDNAPYMILAFNSPEQVQAQIGAVVHIDGTIRPQIVTSTGNPLFHRLIRAFKKLTGQGILLNTSFNLGGEPLVCTPEDAIRCFYSSGMDMLVLGPFVISKQEP